MGIRNYLIEGGSGTGKTTIAEELERRGYHVVHGDRVLAYCGDPETGMPMSLPTFELAIERVLWQSAHHIWDIDKVKAHMADASHEITFFCGHSENYSKIKDLYDGVFVLEVDDLDTLSRRIDKRVARDPTDWGGRPEEKEVVALLHSTKKYALPDALPIDATAPIDQILDRILRICAAPHGAASSP